MESELYDIKKIKNKLIKDLDIKRYEHTIGVADTAACLAMKYNISIEKAYVAGLLHDCAKCFDDKQKIKLCNKYNVKLEKHEIANTSLIHSKLGAQIASIEYGVEDKEILSAISYHTTGKPDMSMLEKIIFSADYIEPNRKKILGIDEIRSVIFNDLNEAVRIILINTIQHLKNKGQFIDKNSLNALEFYSINENKGDANDH